MPSEEELQEHFAKWTKDQEAKGVDWQGKLNRESQLAEKGLDSRVVGFHCPWCRYKTLYYSISGSTMHCITCKLDWEIECVSLELLEGLKADRKLERVLNKTEEKD
jgi:hypothetical protein